MTDAIKTKKFFLYITWCFGLTWIWDGLVISNAFFNFFPEIISKVALYVRAFFPTIAVYILLKKYGEINKRKNIWQFIIDFPRKKNAYIIFFIFLLWRFLVFFINGDMTQSLPLYFLLPFLLMQLLFQGGFEEPGWRGFLQPYFENKFPIAIALLLVSVIWSVWHIPLWFIPGSAQSKMSFIIFFLQILVNTCSLAALLKLTKSVGCCMIYHAWCNAVFLVIPFEINIGIISGYLIEAIVALVICILLSNINKKEKTLPAQ